MKRNPAIRSAVLVAALALAGGVSAAAQNFQGMNTLQNIASEAQNAGKYLVNIAFIAVGLAGAVCLVPAAIKFFKNEPQTKDALTSIGIGLITAFIILAIIKVVMSFT